MEIDSYSTGKVQTYSMLFNRTRFGFSTKLDMEELKYFSNENQNRYGKIDIRLNINALRGLKNNRDFNFLIMTEYSQIIPFIYFLRSEPKECKVLTTKIMLQCAKIYAKDFYRIVKKINQLVSKPTYDEQANVYDAYQAHSGIDFQNWAPIFSLQEIQNFATRCQALNYRQTYDTDRGTIVTPHPSGVNVGSAVWVFENTRTKKRLLWIQSISHHSWRACPEFSLGDQNEQITDVIVAARSMSKKFIEIGDEQQCLQFLKTIYQRVVKGLNSRIVLEDGLVIPDIINYVAIQFKDKLKKMVFTGISMNKYMSYINSYPEFLTENHKRRIFEDPPVYPFHTYEQLRDKHIVQGSIQEASYDRKIPVEEFILRFTPYLQFQSDFHAYLIEGQNEMAEPIFEKSFNSKKVGKLFQIRRVKNITFICRPDQNIGNIPDFELPFSHNPIGLTIFIRDQSPFKFYLTQGISPNLVCQFQKVNNTICLKKIKKKFRQLNKNWHLELQGVMKKQGIEIRECKQHQLSTNSSIVKVEGFKMQIHSSSLRQMQIFNWFIDQCSKIKNFS